jgi:hypothetical protein
MTPGTILGMVIHREFGPALRAGKPRAARMPHRHSDTALMLGELDPGHLPGRLDAQQVAIQLCDVDHLDMIAPEQPLDRRSRTPRDTKRQGCRG